MTTLDRHETQITLPLSFRLASADDLPKLEWFGQYTHFRNVYRRTFREQIAGKRFMLVADCNGFPIGQIFAHFHLPGSGLADRFRKERRAYFYSLRVMEMFRGQGIGTQLIAHAEGIAEERYCTITSIAAAKNNPRARQLYEREGYRVNGEDDGRWSYTDDRGRTCYVHEPCWILEKTVRRG